jgi:hypothetical protein
MNDIFQKVIPLPLFVESLEPVARDLCHLVGFNGDASSPAAAEEGLPQMKNWEVFAMRMILAYMRELPPPFGMDVFCDGMDLLKRTVVPGATRH